MARRWLVRGCIITTVVAACHSTSAPWPTGPADLTGRVVDMRDVAPVGAPGADGGAIGGAAATRNAIQLLRIRVSSGHGALPGSDAIVGVDATTQMARGDTGAGTGPDGRPELTGRFVRVWFRGMPASASPTRYAAMARAVAVDSIARGDTVR